MMMTMTAQALVAELVLSSSLCLSVSLFLSFKLLVLSICKAEF